MVRSTLLYGLLALGLLRGVLAGSAELSTWTSVSGAQVQASFVGIDNDQVVLQPEEGDEVVIRVNLLIPEDQVRARKLHAEGGEEEADNGGLPLLTRGPGKGHHAYYTHEMFDAWVTKNGRLYIHPKESGKRVGRAFHVCPRVRINVNGSRSARFEDFTDYGPATQEPQSVTFEALAEYGDVKITCEVEYTFDQNTICASTEIIDPRRADQLMRAETRFHFSGVEDIPAQMSQSERVKLLEKNVLRWRGGDVRRWQEENFYDSRTLRGQVDEAEISGPWGQRVVGFRGENRRSGNRTSLWNYSGRTLNDGYTFLHRVDLNDRAGTSCVTID